ncbi:hypothetical protein N431DRAFT_563542 [Stipitochalara longipes BDJ]|nr:hypothetical protein N431DRAFT_563542 [Stipitochalara longipes BDJ]
MQDPQYRARELGENFCKALACNCSNGPHPHKASLRLTPYWCHDPSSSHGSVSFDVLLSTLSEPSKWEETMFIADERDNTPSGCSHVEDFCDFIRKLHLTASTPYIILHKDRFFKTKSSRAKQCNGFEPTLSLKSLLDAGFFEPGPNKFQIRTKRILAVVLAHHLLQFAETTLLSNNWNSQNVFFLRRVQDDIPADIHKLFFLTGIDKHNPGGDNEANIDGTSEDNLGGEISKTVGEHAFYRHPSLISLGILLLEMETGKTMQADKEYCDPKTGQKNINTMWTTAGKLLKSPEIQESVYQDFRSVIEVCLEPKKFLPDGLGFGDLKFREKVYENIVAPLELELLDGWPDLDINSLGVSRDFSMHSQNAVEPLSFSQPLLRGNTKQSQKAVDANSAARVTEINGALAPGVLPTALPSILETSVEAGVDLPAVDSMNMRTLPWWKEFQHTLDFMAKHRTDSSTIHTGKRVKVAILDTGYDRFNQDLKDVAASLPSKIGWQDFVRNEKKPVDESESGHGSRVAYFLLQMTTNIDLWIARVYEKDEGIPESAISVKNAIDAAKDLEVDIICMSFGFEKRIDSIARSIEEANAKGILIFAAASNDRGLGSNSPTFPANMNHRVFCINSHTSDMNPKWSSFNPDFVPEQSNFCIIGEGLHGPQKTTTDGVRLKARKFEPLHLFWSMVDHVMTSRNGITQILEMESGNHYSDMKP